MLRTIEGSATLSTVLSRLMRRSVTQRTDSVAQRWFVEVDLKVGAPILAPSDGR
jgi:hypothetical protein